MKNKIKPPTFTVGITTCYGGSSLVETVKSVRASKGVGDFRFIIVADRNPISSEVKQALKKHRVELIENKTEGSQFKKQKQILTLCQNDLIIFTNDDVLFAPNTLKTIIERFEKHPRTTFISIRNEPLPPLTFFEAILNVGTRGNNRLAWLWHKGDNYLSVVGRCMAFRTRFVKQFKLLEEVVSTDAYRYLENKRHDGVYEYLPDSVLYFRNPQSYSEYLKKTSRFQHQQLEMSRYFDDVSREYRVPKLLKLRALIREFISHPLLTLLYVIVFSVTRVAKLDSREALNANWDVDVSTKQSISTSMKGSSV